MKRIILLLVTTALFMGCVTTGKAPEGEDLFLTGIWFPTTDSYGSSFECAEEVIVDGEINVDFVIKQKTGDEWPYIELICQAGKPLSGIETITLDYKCDKPLKIKLSQSDFGSAGDNSYAHYFIEVPPAAEWTQVTVNIVDFAQPSWAQPTSKEIPLNLDNVNDIYLVPAASYQVGESASLSVRSMIIK